MKEGVQHGHFRGAGQDRPEGAITGHMGQCLSYLPVLEAAHFPSFLTWSIGSLFPFAVDWVRDLAC